MDELTPEERRVVLIALWNYKLSVCQGNAQHTEPDALNAVLAHAKAVDDVATKLGGRDDMPLYGVGVPSSGL